MHRSGRFSALLLLALVACQPGAPALRWLSPTSGGTVSGQVRLSVEALGENAPPNVVFVLGDKEVAKAYLKEGGYEALLDTSAVAPGRYTLRAVPYGAPSLPLPITVARKVPGTPDTVTGAPEAPPSAPSLSGDPLNLGGLLDLWDDLAGGSTAQAALQAPGGFPWGSLWRGAALRARTRSLLAQQAPDIIELPRGVYRYDEASAAWEVLPAEAGNLEIGFTYPDPETLAPHEVVVNVIWEAAGRTQVAASRSGEVEVPTGARVLVSDNGETILDLDLSASWRKPEGCSEAILEPEVLRLVGYTSHARPEDGSSASEGDDGEAPERPGVDESDLEFLLTLGTDPLTGEDALATTLDLVTLAGDAQADLSLDLSASGSVERETCFATGGTLSDLSLSAEVGIGLSGGPRRGSRFSVLATRPELSPDGVPTSAFVAGQAATFDEATSLEDVTRYGGSLDETNGDGFPGENVTVTLPEGNETTLDVYVKALFERYRAMIGERIAETRP